MSLAAKQFSAQTARDAEMFFHWSTYLPLALGARAVQTPRCLLLFPRPIPAAARRIPLSSRTQICIGRSAGNLAAGVLVTMPNPGGGMFGLRSSTKPVFYLGLLFGVLGLLFQWIAFGITGLIVSNLLFGVQQALCGSALLFVLLHRWREAKGAAVGAFLGAFTFGELFGSVFGVLAIERAATCTRADVAVPYKECDAQFDYAADDPSDATETLGACVCEGFRPAGPLFVAACLVVCLVGGLYYHECYLGPKLQQPAAAAAGDGTPAAAEAAPTIQSKPQAGLKYIANARGALAGSVNLTSTELFKLVSFNDVVLRSCIAMLLCGGTIQGALHAAINSLHHHDSSHGLDDQVTAEEEKLLHGAYTLVVLVTAPMAGRLSDRLNRKVFVVAVSSQAICCGL